MKKLSLLMLPVALFLIVSTGIAQTHSVGYINDLKPIIGLDLIKFTPLNGEVSVINQVDPESSEVTQNLSEEESITLNSNLNRSSGYTTALGLRAGYTSGISFKHFVSGKAAWELIVGSRWHGVSVTALYELHQGNALGVSGLSWVYGIGARAGFYDGRHYYKKGNCNDPNNPKCYDYYDRNGRGMTALGIVGIGGLEYKFKEIPFTVSLDLIPVAYLNHHNRGFIDGSFSLRYIIK
jgi:hypothetical protein